MKLLIVAGAVLGLSAVSASAECSYHSAEAKTDKITTASVATEQAKMSTVESATEKKAVATEEE